MAVTSAVETVCRSGVKVGHVGELAAEPVQRFDEDQIELSSLSIHPCAPGVKASTWRRAAAARRRVAIISCMQSCAVMPLALM
jgi:hypothetical protein